MAGRDPQGIPWEQLQYTREEYRWALGGGGAEARTLRRSSSAQQGETWGRTGGGPST